MRPRPAQEPPFDTAHQSSATAATPVYRGRLAARRPLSASADSDDSAWPYVKIPLAAKLTGYSQKAIRRKIESGVWVEGQQFRRAPDGRILVSLDGYRQWVERGRV